MSGAPDRRSRSVTAASQYSNREGAEDRPAAPGGGGRLLLPAVALGAILAPLNSTMIAVALPDIRSEFALSHAALAWLISAYLIAMAVAQPISGRLGDQLGRLRVFRASLLAFLALSLAATMAPTFTLLVLLRIGQAAAGAALIPNGMAMLRETVPTRRLGRVNGLFNAALSVSAASGPLIGAAVLEFSSWRVLFLINAPVVAVALLLLARLDYRSTVAAARAQIDWAGGALLAAILVTVTWLLGALNGQAQPAAVVAAVVAATTFLVLFVRLQMSGRSAIAPWALFRNRSFAGATTYIMVSNLVMYTALLTIPFFVSEVQGKGSAATGLLLGVMSFLMAAGSPVSGLLSDRFGRRPPALAGSVIVLVAVVMMVAGIASDTSFAYLAAALGLLGLGIGLGTGAAMTAAIESAPRALAGSAAGANSMMRYIGSIVGAGILAGLLGGGAVPGVGVFRTIYVVLAVMAVVAVIAATQIHGHVEEHAEV